MTMETVKYLYEKLDVDNSDDSLNNKEEEKIFIKEEKAKDLEKGTIVSEEDDLSKLQIIQDE